jgi:hypothetical protein
MKSPADPDRIVTAENWKRADEGAFLQIEPFTSLPTIGPGGVPVSTVLELPVGLYKLNKWGLLPLAFRITSQPVGDEWFTKRQGEIVRFIQEPIIRLFNPGDRLLWRPLFDFEPFPEFQIIRIARPRTYGG